MLHVRVSIPFIAGQWSLLLVIMVEKAVVGTRFNPLHCGAVVSSVRCGDNAEAQRRVSIPFIAGQWSLLFDRPPRRMAGAGFQSPSLRGSGLFASASRASASRCAVSIPFIAGQWSLPGAARRTTWNSSCFNPLHCGAVVSSPSHNALPSLRRPAAEFATCLRPPSLGVLAQVA